MAVLPLFGFKLTLVTGPAALERFDPAVVDEFTCFSCARNAEAAVIAWPLSSTHVLPWRGVSRSLFAESRLAANSAGSYGVVESK